MEVRRAVGMCCCVACLSSLCIPDVVYFSSQLFEMEGTGSERLQTAPAS